MDQVWNKYVENGLCFIVKDATERQVGVSLNYDDNDDFNVVCKSNTIYAWSVLAYVGSPVMSVSFKKNLAIISKIPIILELDCEKISKRSFVLP
jgi:hypothetical protein